MIFRNMMKRSRERSWSGEENLTIKPKKTFLEGLAEVQKDEGADMGHTAAYMVGGSLWGIHGG